METALKKLEEQEAKYAAELEEALKQYAELKAQAADVDVVELMDARMDIRPDRERSAADRIKAAYGEKYNPLMMYDSKLDVANLLNEEAEARSVREFLRQKQKRSRYNSKENPNTTNRDDNIFAGVHFERCTPAFSLYPHHYSSVVFNAIEPEFASFL